MRAEDNPSNPYLWTKKTYTKPPTCIVCGCKFAGYTNDTKCVDCEPDDNKRESL